MQTPFRQRSYSLAPVVAALACAGFAAPAAAQQKLHFTFMWHMEQPIYWPDRQVTNATLGDQYERLAESLARGGVHPLNNLNDIFGLDDRVAGYQWRMRDCINSMLSRPEAGAQISFSGGLIQNIQSVAGTSYIGGRYGSGWTNSLREARGWNTSTGPGVPRADIVLFPFHHALMPLVDDSTMRKQIQTYKAIYPDAWGTGAVQSVGFFPSEMAFSTRMIPALQAEGVQWSIVSGEHISRACANWPVVFGSGGTASDPPNRADQLNPAQANYFRLSIDRGCSPAEAFPFGFTPRRARHIDPNTGAVSSIIAVPASQSLGWRDGYSAQGIADFDALNVQNDPNRPMLVVLAHDGDNAWGGGYDYYMVATPNRVNQGAAAGYTPTVIQRYLADHPVPANDWVHVEDGAWVNADGDFGSPQYWNWLTPLLNSSGQPDPVNGWSEDARNWAVITAMQNRVDTAEQLHVGAGGTITARKIVYPHEGANDAERAWHYFMGALNSGYMYYGTAIDMEVKPTIACNNAGRLADAVIALRGVQNDTTAPTLFVPQRWPYNPGAQGFGWPYRQGSNFGPHTQGPDFTVWTFAYDVSGVQSITLKWRTDNDGVRGIANAGSNYENETYAGGAGVSAWNSVPMNRRAMPAGNVYNDPSIDFFVMPQYIAEHASATIAGQSDKLIDYYVEAVDARGNIRRSAIQHVYVGTGQSSGGGGGCNSGPVTTQPCPPIAGQSVTVSYDPTGRNLSAASQVFIHTGINGWTNVITPDPAMSRVNASSSWTYTFTVPASATVIDCVFNNGSGTWDNNSGQDWHIAVQAAPPANGRCCISGACTITTQSACAGAFTANGTCASACPPDPTGACCIGGACATTTLAACAGGAVAWTSGGACAPNPCPFVIDGQLDGGTVEVARNGTMFLSASLRGDVLYVAAPNTPAGNDRFIYLAPIAGPGALTAANWGKSGQIAGWSALLGAEADNGYIGWQDQTAGVAVASAKNAVMEGAINLRQEFALGAGALPANVWLSFAQFPTGNGTALVASLQTPAGNGNASIEAAEFLQVPLCQFRPGGCCPADFNGQGGLGVQDIFDFLAAWFANDPRADFNGANGVGVQDIFDFLAAWFAGC
jgi:Starch/carbohydrate-binding module (family 53)/Glycosyl hydrolase family 57